jgi:hypothetical protein
MSVNNSMTNNCTSGSMPFYIIPDPIEFFSKFLSLGQCNTCEEIILLSHEGKLYHNKSELANQHSPAQLVFTSKCHPTISVGQIFTKWILGGKIFVNFYNDEFKKLMPRMGIQSQFI